MFYEAVYTSLTSELSSLFDHCLVGVHVITHRINQRRLLVSLGWFNVQG